MAEKKKDDAVFQALKKAFALVKAAETALANGNEELFVEKTNELLDEIKKQISAFCGREIAEEHGVAVANIYFAANIGGAESKYAPWLLSNICNAGLALQKAEADLSAEAKPEGLTAFQTMRLKAVRNKLDYQLSTIDNLLEAVDQSLFPY